MKYGTTSLAGAAFLMLTGCGGPAAEKPSETRDLAATGAVAGLCRR